MSKVEQLDDISLLGDDSNLPAGALEALRELAYRRCEADPIFFLTRFWWCMNPDSFVWELFNLRPYQIEDAGHIIDMMRGKRERAVILKARQIGYTTLTLGLAFWDAFFHPNHPWLIASQGEDEAQDTLLTKVKAPYARLPRWLRERGPKPIDDNKESFTFDNGSSILSIPSTSSAARSKWVYGALLDEFAFVQDGGALFASVDPLCYGPLFVVSTARGMGDAFHQQWLESQEHDTEWRGFFRAWHEVPERGPFTKDKDGKVTSEWYRRELKKYRGQEHRFYAENPGSPEEAFSRSGRTVIPLGIVRETVEPPRWKLSLPRVNREELLDEDVLDRYQATEDEEQLWVWEAPFVLRDERDRVVQVPNYVVACDVALGLEDGDRTSIWVIDANTGEQVAGYRGHWLIDDLGALLDWLARSYHTALLMVERNNSGILPLTDLQRLAYPRLYRTQKMADTDRTRNTQYGWHTTPSTKPKMVLELIESIRKGDLIVRDTRFVAEATVFVADGRGGYAASAGNYDDHVIGGAIGNQGLLEVGRFPVIWRDDWERPTTIMDLKVQQKQRNARAPMRGVGQGARPAKEVVSFTL